MAKISTYANATPTDADYILGDQAAGPTTKTFLFSAIKTYLFNTPTLVTPHLGTPADGVLTNCTGLPIAGGGTGGTTILIAQQNLQVPSAAGYIIGLGGLWVSASQVGAAAGACYIESLGYSLYGAPANITLASPSNNTIYHVYGFSNAGTLTLEINTTAPVAFATPVGNARSKTGDTSRRYLYSVLTDASGNIFNFRHDSDSGVYSWVNTAPNGVGGTPFRILSNGSAQVSTTIDFSTLVPSTVRFVAVNVTNLTGTGQTLYVGNGDFTVDSTHFNVGLGPNLSLYAYFPVNASQIAKYILTGGTSGNGAYIDTFGFILDR